MVFNSYCNRLQTKRWLWEKYPVQINQSLILYARIVGGAQEVGV
jgi:hypothetical protein